MSAENMDPANISTRQKVTAVVFLLVVIFLGWQLISMMRGSSESTAPSDNMSSGNAPHMTAPQVPPPQPSPAPKQDQALTQAEVMQLQQQKDLESRYVNALNELQILKLSKEIAETNQAIAKAKLDTVTAQKDTLNILAPAPAVSPASYAQALSNPTAAGANINQAQQPPKTEAKQQASTQSTKQEAVTYNVISVSQLQNKWQAVLGYQGSLYQVGIGDVLPSDQSKVVDINSSGVTLEKDGEKRKFSIVSII